MGMVRSTIDLSGAVIEGILLGSPAQDGAYYIWDDHRLPNLEIGIIE